MTDAGNTNDSVPRGRIVMNSNNGVSSESDRFYLGDTGTISAWRQCRYCWGYVEGPPGHTARVHRGDCPVAVLEALEWRERVRIRAQGDNDRRTEGDDAIK